jgi:hypothetical protein
VAVLSKFNNPHSDVLFMKDSSVTSRLRAEAGFPEHGSRSEVFMAPLPQSRPSLFGPGGTSVGWAVPRVSGGFQQLRNEVGYQNVLGTQNGGNASKKRKFHQIDADSEIGRFLTNELHASSADTTAIVPMGTWDARDSRGASSFKLPPPPNSSALEASRNDTQLIPFSIIRPYNPTSLPHVGRPRFIEGVTDDAERKRRHDHRVKRRIAQCRWPEGKLSFELRGACAFPHVRMWFPYVNTTEKLLFARYYKMVDHFDYVQNFVAAELQCNHCSLSRIITGEYPYQTKAIFVKRFRAWIYLVDRSVSMALQQHIKSWDGKSSGLPKGASSAEADTAPVLATAIDSGSNESACKAVAVRAVVAPATAVASSRPFSAVEESLISNELIAKVAEQLEDVDAEQLTSWFECTMTLDRRSQIESKLLGFFKSFTYEQTRMEIPLASSTLHCGRLTHGIQQRHRQLNRVSNRDGRHAKQLRDEAEDDAMSSVFIAAAQELVEQRNYRQALSVVSHVITTPDIRPSVSSTSLLPDANKPTTPAPPVPARTTAPVLRALRSAHKPKTELV